MARQPFQVLVIPFRRRADGAFDFAIFKRSDDGRWQGVAGGVEHGETAEQAARREMQEEAGIPTNAHLIALDTIASVRACIFPQHEQWGSDVYVVTERTFGAHLPDEHEIVLSREHTEHQWVTCAQAQDMLAWDSNKTAVWELNERLIRSQRT